MTAPFLLPFFAERKRGANQAAIFIKKFESVKQNTLTDRKTLGIIAKVTSVKAFAFTP